MNGSSQFAEALTAYVRAANASRDKEPPTRPGWRVSARGTADGTIRVRRLGTASTVNGVVSINAAPLVRMFLDMLEATARWPREVTDVGGSLEYHLVVGNIASSVMVLSESLMFEYGLTSSAVQRREPGPTLWEDTGIWEPDQSARDVLQRHLTGLGRQLQAPWLEVMLPKLFEWAGRGDTT